MPKVTFKRCRKFYTLQNASRLASRGAALSTLILTEKSQSATSPYFPLQVLFVLCTVEDLLNS